MRLSVAQHAVCVFGSNSVETDCLTSLCRFETLSGLEEFMSRGTATPEQRQYFADQINAMTDEGKALATDGAGV